MTNDTPISELSLSGRAVNVLTNYDDHTVGDLLARTRQELLQRKNFGRKTLKEIERALAKRGLCLRGPPGPPAVNIEYRPTRVVMEQLGSLAEHGMFGVSLHDVLDRLVCDRLRELALEGWLPPVNRRPR